MLAHVDTAADGEWCVASAGHHLPLLTDGRTVVSVGTTGTILGLLDTIEVEDSAFLLEDGGTLVFSTDGITEARAADGTFFGDERLAETVRALASEPGVALARGRPEGARIGTARVTPP